MKPRKWTPYWFERIILMSRVTWYSNCTVLSELKQIKFELIIWWHSKTTTLSIGNAISLKSSIALQGAESLFPKNERRYLLKSTRDMTTFWFGLVEIELADCYSRVVCQSSRWCLSLWLVIVHQTCLGNDRHVSNFGDQDNMTWWNSKETVSCK